ncbi:MAG: RluA family pseudouridine synthase [Actinomycetota bacterium]|nr:RluA family pseudouridine synthase [Actinomycetota bacterium]
MEKYRLIVGEDDDGIRLDRFLSGRIPISRTQAQRLISERLIRVEGEVKSKNHRLHTGLVVEAELPEPREPEPEPQDIPIDIVYQDGDLAVVNKPAGLVVHPAAGHVDGTLVNALLFRIKDLSGVGGVLRPGIVHRLDRLTSGLLVVAKNDEAHVKLQEMVQDRVLKRYYLALVHGIPKTRLGTVDAPVGRDAEDRKKMAVTTERGRPSRTLFKVLHAFPEAALLEVELITGRTHQIRVHLSYIGHPVVGDSEYGHKVKIERRLGLERQFLHAKRLAFPHPRTGKEMDFEVPLPLDLETALERLRNA